MDRRNFIGTAAASLLIADVRAAVAQTTHAHGAVLSASARQQLSAIAKQYHADLFVDFLPFMEKYVIDPEYGGFMCLTDGKGVHTGTTKFAWFEGRGIWVYSYLYNNLAPEKKYLEVARKSVEFIMRHKPTDPLTTWCTKYTREGKPLTGPDPEIYGNMFIAEGLAQYSVAAKEPQYWDQAKEIVLDSVRIYDGENYYPQIGRTYLGPNARTFPGARIQGVWMTLIRATTELLRTRADKELEALAKRCVDAVINHHFNPRFDLNNELLNHDLSRPTNEYEQLVYTGHSIETLWMMMDEALRERDMTLFRTIADRFQRHVEVARDRVYDGVFRNLMNVDDNVWSLDKVLWAQAEVTIGSLMIYQQTGEQWAWDTYLHFNKYTHEKYSLKQFGIPLWIYGADRQVTTESYFKEPARVENYHQPRHIMLNLVRLQSMLR